MWRFFEWLHEFCQVNLLALIELLPSEMSAEERTTCLHEYERVRAQLVFSLTLKLSPCMEAPCRLAGIAHPVRSKAILSVRVCLASSSDHPRVRELSDEGDLRVEALIFMDGANLRDAPWFDFF